MLNEPVVPNHSSNRSNAELDRARRGRASLDRPLNLTLLNALIERVRAVPPLSEIHLRQKVVRRDRSMQFGLDWLPGEARNLAVDFRRPCPRTVIIHRDERRL